MTAPATKEEFVSDIRAAPEELGGPPSITKYPEREAGLSQQPTRRIFESSTATV